MVTEGNFLRWNITVLGDQGDGRETMIAYSFVRTFSSTATSTEQSPVNTSSAIITFARSSAVGHTPVVSEILITRILNGSIVKCIELATSESVAVMVHVMDLTLQCKCNNTHKQAMHTLQ